MGLFGFGKRKKEEERRKAEIEARETRSELVKKFLDEGKKHYAIADRALQSKEFDTATENYSLAEENLLKASELGSAEANYYLGLIYRYGVRLMNKKKSLEMLEKAADAGYSEAQIECYRTYDQGLGVERNPDKARYWIEKAAESGSMDAQFELGFKCYNRDTDYAKAVQWFRKAAYNGHAEAQFYYAQMFFEGNGVAEDHKEALRWMEKSAQKGFSTALFNCAVFYESGVGTAVDKAAAYNYYAKLAETKLSEDDTAKELFVMRASVKCAQMCYDGDGIPENTAKALYWYEKAAELGNVEAQKKCGQMYFDGEGTQADYYKAYHWFEEASGQGDDEAMFVYAYLNEVGANGDMNKALACYEELAEKGYSDAMVKCGELYRKGCGTTGDFDKARYWLKKAIENGNDEAQEEYDLLEAAEKEWNEEAQTEEPDSTDDDVYDEEDEDEDEDEYSDDDEDEDDGDDDYSDDDEDCDENETIPEESTYGTVTTPKNNFSLEDFQKIKWDDIQL